MANTMAFSIRDVRTDTYYRHAGIPEAQVAVAATDTATPTPDEDTPYIDTGAIDTIRLLVAYDGTVSAAKLRLWLLQDGTWYRAGGVELNPADGNESYDATGVGQYTRFAVQVEEITGGGTVEVRVLGVR